MSTATVTANTTITEDVLAHTMEYVDKLQESKQKKHTILKNAMELRKTPEVSLNDRKLAIKLCDHLNGEIIDIDVKLKEVNDWLFG